MTATVKYNIGTYEGTMTVGCKPEDTPEIIISKAAVIMGMATYPFSISRWTHNWRVISRTDNNN